LQTQIISGKSNATQITTFSTYLNQYKDKLQSLFSDPQNQHYLQQQRGIPSDMLKGIMEHKPLSVFIPSEYDGRGGKVGECLSVLETSGYESLALSLMVGINGALFLQPLANYGNDEAKKAVFDRFMNHGALGGLMITEPEYGSDALKMQTSFDEMANGYAIKGTKHWGGLTSWADFWLITARRRNENGDLARDIDFFVHDTRNHGLEVTEIYRNLGLMMLPYGRNELDILVPKSYRLEPEATGLKMMLDILHRSRIQFPGMGMGFLRRMLDEAIGHCKDRFVGGQSLFNYDQVKRRLAELQASFTICSAMCANTTENAGMDVDLSKEDLQANSVKTVLTDLMQNAAQSLMQLVGAKGYSYDHIAGRAIVDSRPFQIFEGSNDILYQQISESVVKGMRKLNIKNLYEYLKSNELTTRSADYLKDSLNFEIDIKMAQDKLVHLGQGIGRILALESVIKLGDRGFNSNLIKNAIEFLDQEINTILCSYQHVGNLSMVENYQDESSWLSLVRSGN
jgi:alkylation response protein AidB-like acyl-CoA dehydrogenase